MIFKKLSLYVFFCLICTNQAVAVSLDCEGILNVSEFESGVGKDLMVIDMPIFFKLEIDYIAVTVNGFPVTVTSGMITTQGFHASGNGDVSQCSVTGKTADVLKRSCSFELDRSRGTYKSRADENEFTINVRTKHESQGHCKVAKPKF
jgi:hypothetical protein